MAGRLLGRSSRTGTNIPLGDAHPATRLSSGIRSIADAPGAGSLESIGGESDNAGEVVFDKRRMMSRTIVTAVSGVSYGQVGYAWEPLVGATQSSPIIENLRHYKRSPKPENSTTQGQPLGLAA
jgi:hypothetical protein